MFVRQSKFLHLYYFKIISGFFCIFKIFKIMFQVKESFIRIFIIIELMYRLFYRLLIFLVFKLAILAQEVYFSKSVIFKLNLFLIFCVCRICVAEIEILALKF